ncbi:MAG: extracellular solute-binding protein [Oscillospiraceae bacterium]|nr:extracellular solute-binding protein [Oscillospiraceae bacterium]
MTKLKRILTVGCAVALLTTGLTACKGGKGSIDPDDPVITIMTSAAQPEPASEDSPVLEALEQYLGTRLQISFIPASGYGEKVTATMGSGEYPMVMLVETKTASIIQNARGGTFWDITDKIKDSAKYPNLSQANDVVLNNTSIDGKIYGLYRARTLGRSGMCIREDWLETLGMSMPETMDEFHEVLKAFKEKDPDGNGQADTFGMIMTTASTTLDAMVVWFGAPNKWGEAEDGTLQPDFMFDEYFECLKFLRTLYEEELINQDFATYDGAKWDEQFLSSRAGVIIDVADRSRRIAENMAKSTPKAKVGVIGYVKRDAGSEARTLPTSGWKGFYVFPKPAVPQESDLDFILDKMDKMNDQEALNLMNFGIKGRHYEIEEDGFAKISEDTSIGKEYADLNQVATGIIETQLKKRYSTDVAEKADIVMKDNEKYIVSNPAEPLVSDTYSMKGPQLDEIISSANTKFIVGKIDEAAYKKEIEKWRSQGGDEYIKEINDAYNALK